MKMKKIIIYIMFFILIPIIFAAVTRNIQDINWICPSGFDVRLIAGGAQSTYGAEETLGETWQIVYSSHSYTPQDPFEGKKKILFAGINKNEDIVYTLVVPSGSYSISGLYVLDSGNEKPIGTTNFVVRTDTCNAGTEEDLDGDGFGKGCACDPPLRRTDCNDNDNTIYPGAPEVENDGIDQDCNGCDFVDLDDDGFRKSGTGCGANDCNDDNPAINPGADEVCDGVDNNCNVEACDYGDGAYDVVGDCCPSTNVNDLSYYDKDCDCGIDYCDPKPLFITKYLAGEINPPLQMVIDAIDVCSYSNP